MHWRISKLKFAIINLLNSRAFRKPTVAAYVVSHRPKNPHLPSTISFNFHSRRVSRLILRFMSQWGFFVLLVQVESMLDLITECFPVWAFAVTSILLLVDVAFAAALLIERYQISP